MFLLYVFSSISWARLCVFIQYHQDCWSCGSSPAAIIWLASNISHFQSPYWLGRKITNVHVIFCKRLTFSEILSGNWFYLFLLKFSFMSKISLEMWSEWWVRFARCTSAIYIMLVSPEFTRYINASHSLCHFPATLHWVQSYLVKTLKHKNTLWPWDRNLDMLNSCGAQC